MKVATACILSCLLYCPTAFAGDPGEAALEFLSKVKEGRLSLEPGADTAILGQTTEAKRKTIRQAVDVLKTELSGADLELGAVREDGGFAAAMVRRAGGFDSAEIQVYPVALVKRGEKWLPAPVLASFENAVAGYTLPVRQRLAELEAWMSRERVTDLEKLISDSARQTRELIRERIVGEELEGDDLGKITDGFLAACGKGDRAAILGFLGGLSNPLPADWGVRLQASKSIAEGRPIWRPLFAPEIVRVRVREECGQSVGVVTIAWLDPSLASDVGVRLIDLDFSRDSGGQWRIDLPNALLHGSADGDDDDGNDDSDDALLNGFPEKLRSENPPLAGDSAREAAQAVMSALSSGGIKDTLRRIDLSGRPGDARIACQNAAAVWWSLNDPKVFRVPVELGFREEGAFAVRAYQLFVAADPDRFEPCYLFFRKTDQGWLWCPLGLPKGGNGQDQLTRWIEAQEGEWRITWRATLLKPSVRLDAIAFGQPADEGEARELVGVWLRALSKRDMDAALGASAWLGEADEIPAKALRNIGYEITNAGEGEPQLAAIHRSESWLAATVRRVSGDRVLFGFLPIVGTPSGLRLLPEIDLVAEDTRTRNFLNRTSFERLGKFAGEEKARELKELFEKASKEVNPR